MKIQVILALAGLAGAAQADVLINEFQPNPVGADPAMQTVELLGNANDSFSGFLYEIDTDFAPGTIDRIEAVSGTFDANGLFVANVADFENPSATYILASGGSAAINDVFDAGNFATQFGTIFDAVNTADAPGDLANSVASIVGGFDLGEVGSEPILIQRDSVTGEWLQFANFNVYHANGDLIGSQDSVFPGFDPTVGTFGGVNLTLVPAPASVALLGLGGLVATRRRR